MKKSYIAPELDLIRLTGADVICSSNCVDVGGSGNETDLIVPTE